MECIYRRKKERGGGNGGMLHETYKKSLNETMKRGTYERYFNYYSHSNSPPPLSDILTQQTHIHKVHRTESIHQRLCSSALFWIFLGDKIRLGLAEEEGKGTKKGTPDNNNNKARLKQAQLQRAEAKRFGEYPTQPVRTRQTDRQ